jgi:hypothetical protein
MVYVMEIADLHGIAKGLRTRGIVDALQGKRTGQRNGASQRATSLASDLGMSVPPLEHTHVRGRVCHACQAEGKNHGVWSEGRSHLLHICNICVARMDALRYAMHAHYVISM